MGYPTRFEAAGAVFNVTQHATGFDALFVDAFDRDLAERLIRDTCRRYSWVLVDYCLMTNHLHLLVKLRALTLGRGMQWFMGTYARRFNQRHGRAGHLVQERFHSLHVETEEHLLRCRRYFALNPVVAGICRHPSEWPWSGYGGGGRLAPPPDALVHEMVEAELARWRLRAP